MTDEQIIKALEYCCGSIQNDCRDCPFGERCENDESLLKYSLDLINRQKAKIEQLERNFRAAKVDAKLKTSEIERLNNELVSADEVIGFREAEIERLQKIIVGFMDEVGTWSNKYDVDISNINKLPLLAKEDFNIKNKIKSEAYKEFAERLCKDRVSNDPVVIAVKVELEELTEGGNEDGMD